MSGDDDTEKKVEAEVDQEEVEKAKAEIAEEVRIFMFGACLTCKLF